MTLQMDSRHPVVVLGCEIGGLAIIRSLGRYGISVHGVDADPNAPGLLSRYCAGRHIIPLWTEDTAVLMASLRSIGDTIGTRSILIPTTDELALLISRYHNRLSEYFLYPAVDPDLVGRLIDKSQMYHLARDHDIPTPEIVLPQSIEDVESYGVRMRFPVMLKAIMGNRLFARTGKKMIIARSAGELRDWYLKLEDPQVPSLMLQELIPGDDDQVFIFNGYFNEKSDCQSPFTGRKLRQYPIHTGCASLGICEENAQVAELTVRFMKAIGYRGVLDIGYRLDPRDGQYKVLDINPRVGQAFRMFVSHGGLDVVRDMYMDLTGQVRVRDVPKTGRKWIIEDFDLISCRDYRREGTLSLAGWVKSFRGIREAAYFSWRDLRPFFSRLRMRLGRQLNKVVSPSVADGDHSRITAVKKSGG